MARGIVEPPRRYETFQFRMKKTKGLGICLETPLLIHALWTFFWRAHDTLTLGVPRARWFPSTVPHAHFAQDLPRKENVIQQRTSCYQSHKTQGYCVWKLPEYPRTASRHCSVGHFYAHSAFDDVDGSSVDLCGCCYPSSHSLQTLQFQWKKIILAC